MLRLSKKEREKRKCRVYFGKRDLGKCEVGIDVQVDTQKRTSAYFLRPMPTLPPRMVGITLNNVKDTRWLRIPSPARKMVIKTPDGQQYIGKMLLTVLYSNKLVLKNTGCFTVKEK